jgi:hypothetical protein
MMAAIRPTTDLSTAIAGPAVNSPGRAHAAAGTGKERDGRMARS